MKGRAFRTYTCLSLFKSFWKACKAKCEFMMTLANCDNTSWNKQI